MKCLPWIVAVPLIWCGSVSAQDFLAERHIKQGVSCADCHGTAAPAKGAFVDSSACMKCHGSYDKVAALTQGLGKRNPHDAHIGRLDCTVCHHGHVQPELYCASCHSDLGLKTP